MMNRLNDLTDLEKNMLNIRMNIFSMLYPYYVECDIDDLLEEVEQIVEYLLTGKTNSKDDVESKT